MAGLSILHSTSPEDHLENFCKKVVCQSVSDNEQKTLVLLLKNFRPEDHTFFCVSRGMFWGTTVFRKENTFSRHQISSEIFSVFCQNFFGGPAKTVIHLSKGTIWEKYFPWKKYVLFHSISEKQSKKFSLVAQIFQCDFKESMLPIQKRHFDQIFHGNVFASYRHWAGETFFDLWQKSFLQVCNKCALFVHIAIWMIFEFSWKKTTVSQSISDINFEICFRTFTEKFSAGFFGAAFYVYRRTFIGISSENVFLCLSDTRSLIFGLWAKVLTRVF